MLEISNPNLDHLKQHLQNFMKSFRWFIYTLNVKVNVNSLFDTMALGKSLHPDIHIVSHSCKTEVNYQIFFKN